MTVNAAAVLDASASIRHTTSDNDVMPAVTATRDIDSIYTILHYFTVFLTVLCSKIHYIKLIMYTWT